MSFGTGLFQYRFFDVLMSFGIGLFQYRCYDVLLKILDLHPPTTPRAIELYLAVLNNTGDGISDQRNIIRYYRGTLSGITDRKVLFVGRDSSLLKGCTL
jgi:hypothetical protein